jgi:hypothetical protein
MSTTRTQRRAAVVVQVVVVLGVLIGFGALVIDVGMMYNTRADLQHAADAAALAGAAFFTTDQMVAIRMGTQSNVLSTITAETRSLSQPISVAHTAYGQVPIALESGDIVPGLFDFNNPTAPLSLYGVAPFRFNAVEVVVKRTAESQNGPLELAFANIFGNSQANVTASAVAGFDDRFSAFQPQSENTGLTPFVIHRQTYEGLLTTGPDIYGWDPVMEQVSAFGDGVREVHLFPYKESGDGDGVGSGNFGMLNIGIPNLGTPGLSDQILNGVTSEHLEDEVGTSEMTFVDEFGNPVTYDITGNTGFMTSLEPDVEARVGDIIGFFLYDVLVDPGSNATYTISTLRWGRVVGVNLGGPPETRHIAIQPVVYWGDDIRVEPTAQSSNGMVGVLMLLR